MRPKYHCSRIFTIVEIFILCFALLQAVAAQTLTGQKGFYVSASALYDMMTDDFYDIYALLDNGFGYQASVGFRLSSLFHLEASYWSSTHNAYPIQLTQEGKEAGIAVDSESMRFYGIEGRALIMLKKKGKFLPYVSVGTARLWLWSPNDEGYRGMDYSAGIGLDYWLNDRISIGAEGLARYVVYNGIRIGGQDKDMSTYPYWGSMVSFTFVRLCYHFR